MVSCLKITGNALMNLKSMYHQQTIPYVICARHECYRHIFICDLNLPTHLGNLRAMNSCMN